MATRDHGGTQAAIIWGAVLGAAAYVVGYLVAYVWSSSAVSEALRGVNAVSQVLSIGTIPSWKAVGWLFYDAHFARTKVPGLGGATSISPIDALGDGQFAALYVIVPLLLVIAGAIAGRTGPTPDVAVPRGAAIVIGYLPLAVIGIAVTAFRIPGVDARIGIDALTGVALAGLVYPLVFGAIGGGIAWFVVRLVSGDRQRSMGSSRL